MTVKVWHCLLISSVVGTSTALMGSTCSREREQRFERALECIRREGVPVQNLASTGYGDDVACLRRDALMR